ncbi:MAG: hypothetical protein AAF984_07400 [Verrucomicrobiota bacterium]
MMKRNWILRLIWMMCLSSFPLTQLSAKTEEYAQEIKNIELTDPVSPDKPKRKHDLIVYKDSEGIPSGYAMNLINEVCLDGLCKLVEVTMYWDAMGFYERLEYPEGKPLTKLEHEPFVTEDYEKLDVILKDKNSILNNHTLGYLAKEPDNEGETVDEDVDGESHATPAEVKKAVVQDAAWTTWVLWKYANTEIVPILRNTTELAITPKYIEQMLDSDDWRKIEFVMNYLIELDATPSQYKNKVLQIITTAKMDQIELALACLEEVINDKNKFYKELIGVLSSLENYSAALVIEQMASDENLDHQVVDYLTNYLYELSFYPIQLSFRLIEQRDFFSKDVEKNVTKLLEHEDFFTARRASEFLAMHELSPQTEKKLQSFRDKFADRL